VISEMRAPSEGSPVGGLVAALLVVPIVVLSFDWVIDHAKFPFALAVVTIGLVYAAVSVLTYRLLSTRRLLAARQDELAERIAANHRLQRLLVSADEEVRRSVAEALHGPVQGRLLAAEMRLVQLGESTSLDDQARYQLADILDSLQTLRDEDVRRLSHLLHPAALDVGLVVAVRSLVAQMESMYDLQIDLSVDDRIVAVDGPGRRGLPPPARLTIYRALEESITNAHRHGGATRLAVFLEIKGDDILCLRVKDDGKGLTDDVQPGFGLTAIATRAEARGGRVTIDQSDGGVELQAEVRVRRSDLVPDAPVVLLPVREERRRADAS
jgi:signal transduction histidine kinase